MAMLGELLETLLLTVRDVLPIAVIVFGFQVFVLRRPIPNLKRVLRAPHWEGRDKKV